MVIVEGGFELDFNDLDKVKLSFSGLSEDEKKEFVSTHIGEILFQSRHNLELTRNEFLSSYFVTEKTKGGCLSLRSLVRYETEYLKSIDYEVEGKRKKTKAHLSNPALSVIIKNFGDKIEEIYKEQLYIDFRARDGAYLAYFMDEMGLLDYFEKAIENAYMIFLDERDKITKEEYIQDIANDAITELQNGDAHQSISMKSYRTRKSVCNDGDSPLEK